MKKELKLIIVKCRSTGKLFVKVNPSPVPISDEEKKSSSIFIFTHFCGASKGFMKAFHKNL